MTAGHDEAEHEETKTHVELRVRGGGCQTAPPVAVIRAATGAR